MFDRVSKRMAIRSATLLQTIDDRLDSILKCWLLTAGIACMVRILLSSHTMPVASVSTFASYALVVVAPFASTLLALRWFEEGHLQQQPAIRLSCVSNWLPLSRGEAESHTLYGPKGFMVSLLIGLMINVPVRAVEYLAAMPPIPVTAPHWLSMLHIAMTADVVIFTSLYMIAFVAALRRVPLFPRLLLVIWLGDLTMQLATAQMVASTHVPSAVASALQALLTGNVKKVLISIVLWLPYLLLSTRVNVTYRHRIPA